MPPFTLRFANRSVTSTQDWIIHNLDQFTLPPDYVQVANVNVNNDHTFNIAANTTNTFAAASLTYTALPNAWTLNTITPNEWQLAQGNGFVTVRCLLRENPNLQSNASIGYDASEPHKDPGV